MQQLGEDGAHVEAAVEAILEFGRVTMSVLGKAEGMVGIADGSPQIAQQRIDRPKLQEPDACLPAPSDHALMLGPHNLGGAESIAGLSDARLKGDVKWIIHEGWEIQAIERPFWVRLSRDDAAARSSPTNAPANPDTSISAESNWGYSRKSAIPSSVRMRCRSVSSRLRHQPGRSARARISRMDFASGGGASPRDV